jgi:hypothetical protein
MKKKECDAIIREPHKSSGSGSDSGSVHFKTKGERDVRLTELLDNASLESGHVVVVMAIDAVSSSSWEGRVYVADSIHPSVCCKI